MHNLSTDHQLKQHRDNLKSEDFTDVKMALEGIDGNSDMVASLVPDIVRASIYHRTYDNGDFNEFGGLAMVASIIAMDGGDKGINALIDEVRKNVNTDERHAIEALEILDQAQNWYMFSGVDYPVSTDCRKELVKFARELLQFHADKEDLVATAYDIIEGDKNYDILRADKNRIIED
jgi:hypothetical protein